MITQARFDCKRGKNLIQYLSTFKIEEAHIRLVQKEEGLQKTLGIIRRDSDSGR